MTRKIIGFDISYDKNPETIQKIIDSSPKAKQYYSDGYNGYFKAKQYYSDGYNGYFSLNYHGGKYKFLNNKSQTYNIGVKGVNSDLRKYIHFLQ